MVNIASTISHHRPHVALLSSHITLREKVKKIGKNLLKLSKLKMDGATSTEVSAKKQTHEHTMKINNFKRFVNTQEDFRSNFTEIFPVFIESALR